MLHYAVVFFVIALIAAVFGFGGIAGCRRDRQGALRRVPGDGGSPASSSTSSGTVSPWPRQPLVGLASPARFGYASRPLHCIPDLLTLRIAIVDDHQIVRRLSRVAGRRAWPRDRVRGRLW